MSNQVKNKPTVWFWVLGVLALLWNLMGVVFYLLEAYQNEEAMAAYTVAQKEFLFSQPAWLTGAWAFAVFGGTLACLALLIRKKWATPLFMISLLAVIARTGYFFFLTNATELFDMVNGTILPIAIIIIAGLLLIFSKIATERRWIN